MATWDLGHGGGTILGAVYNIAFTNSFPRDDALSGPVSCVVLQPVLRMVSQLLHKHPNVTKHYVLYLTVVWQYHPPPAYEAKVVAAAVGTGGLVVVMISSVGLVQVLRGFLS